MTTTIKIGNKETKLEANGATPHFFNMVFKQDFFLLTDAAVAGTADIGPIEAWSRCAYIMAMQAKGKEVKDLSLDTYAKWLEGFGPTDVANAVGDVIDVWHGTTKTTAKPKK